MLPILKYIICRHVMQGVWAHFEKKIDLSSILREILKKIVHVYHLRTVSVNYHQRKSSLHRFISIGSLSLIERKKYPSIHLQGHGYLECFFIHRDSDNAWHSNAHSSIVTPCFTLISNYATQNHGYLPPGSIQSCCDVVHELTVHNPLCTLCLKLTSKHRNVNSQFTSQRCSILVSNVHLKGHFGNARRENTAGEMLH